MMITQDTILRKAGFGDTTDNALLFAAQAVTDPCTSDINQPGGGNQAVQSFQEAWNATTDSSFGSPQLTPDGKYGPKTAGALTAVLGTGAPASCPQYATPTPAPSGGGGGPVQVPITTITGTPPTNWTPWIIGGAVVLGGATIYGLARYKKRHGHLPGMGR